MNIHRARLISGLILMAFATSHLLNHSFGLISLDAMETARQSILGFWHKPWFKPILLMALLVHIACSLTAIVRRRQARMPLWQLGQVFSGLLIPVWLTAHIVGTAGIQLVNDANINYYTVIPILWPGLAERQIFMSLLIWGHGCVGVYFWLRHQPIYPRLQPWLLISAILLPVLSMAGFVAGGKDLAWRQIVEPGLVGDWHAEFNWPDAADLAWTQMATDGIVIGFSALLVAGVIWWIGRQLIAARRGKLVIIYENGERVSVPPHTSVLEASLIASLPHASICGGRGRCSTCRVRVAVLDNAQLPPPDDREARVLNRLGALPDVRLACQLRPLGKIRVTRLMSPAALPHDAFKPLDPGQGTERDIAILFADLRGFTRLSESRLPFDVVHLLNRYFTIMGEAIEAQGGQIDKFIGDGIMALFGIGGTSQEAADQALRAASRMGQGLKRLNSELAGDLPEPLRMAIGIHMGMAIVGEMGYGRAVGITAIGDSVNTASRLEAAAKDLDAELVVSSELLKRSTLKPTGGEIHDLEIRGRRRKLAVQAFTQCADILPAAPKPTQRSWRTRLLGVVRTRFAN